jgi:GT2 family glycosyltransferase
LTEPAAPGKRFGEQVTEPRIYIVIPVHDRLAFTRECLTGLFADEAARAATIVVVDDGSSDGTSTAIAEEFPTVKVLHGDGTLWWTGAMNVGVGWALALAALHDVVLSLNNDTLPPAGYLTGLLRAHAAAPRALIGSLQVSATDRETLVDGGVTIDWPTAKFRTVGRGQTVGCDEPPGPDLRRTDVLGGCGTLIPVNAFRETGPYWEQGLRHYAADYELSRRAARAGFDLFVDWGSPLYVREAETGIHASVGGGGVTGLLRSFWGIRSANDFRVRWRFAVAACPRWALPSYLVCDYVRVVVGSVRRYRSR